MSNLTTDRQSVNDGFSVSCITHLKHPCPLTIAHTPLSRLCVPGPDQLRHIPYTSDGWNSFTSCRISCPDSNAGLQTIQQAQP